MAETEFPNHTPPSDDGAMRRGMCPPRRLNVRESISTEGREFERELPVWLVWESPDGSSHYRIVRDRESTAFGLVLPGASPDDPPELIEWHETLVAAYRATL